MLLREELLFPLCAGRLSDTEGLTLDNLPGGILSKVQSQHGDEDSGTELVVNTHVVVCECEAVLGG